MHLGFITTIYFIFLQIFDGSTKLGEIALERNASKLRLGQLVFLFFIFWGLLVLWLTIS
ncbi:unnamed protein product [Meloidogyne enterolobii]|uniref:Uncharacterized protein n=1 Tax=Meloidogyne enterolobii TaxID=390850 RepID=A0ACB1B9K6_MELEN